jgi:hypothetical protein
VQELAEAAENWPATHVAHAVWPDEPWNWPAWQELQLVEEAVLENVPAAQSVQALAACPL